MKQRPILNPGDKIHYQYQVIRSLGEGQFSQVYEVETQRLKIKHRYALKLLDYDPVIYSEKEVLNAFQFEFSLLKEIDHPHLVKVYDFGYDEKLEKYYFTQECLEGEPLHLSQNLSPQKLKKYFIQALEALEILNNQGLIHGDIKLSHLFLISKEDKIKLIDFGLAHPDYHQSSGTPAYYPPEKILETEVDIRSDLYALALSFYEIISGQNPFVQNHSSKTLEAQLYLKPVPLRNLNANVPEDLAQVIDRLLEKNPEDRYAGIQEVKEALHLKQSGSNNKKRESLLRSLKHFHKNLRPQFLSEVLSKVGHSSQKKTYILSGEKGVGKTFLLNQIRFNLQLQGYIEIDANTRIQEEPVEKGFLILEFDSEDDLKKEWDQTKKVLQVITCPSIKNLAAYSSAEVIEIPHLTNEEIESGLKILTGQKKFSNKVVEFFAERSQGLPLGFLHLIEDLVKVGRVVNVEGQLDFSLLLESGFYRDFKSTPQNLEDYLRSHSKLSVSDKAQLLLVRADQMIKIRQPDQVEKILNDLEGLIYQVSDLNLKIKIRVGFLEKKIWWLIQKKKNQEALILVSTALALSQDLEMDEKYTELRIRNYQAYLLSERGDWDQSLAIYEKVEAEVSHLPHQSEVYNGDKGGVYLQMGEDKRALAYYLEQIEFYKTVPLSQYLMSRAYYNLAEIYYRQKQMELALENYSKAKELAIDDEYWEILLRVYNGIGNLYYQQKKLDQALDYYERGSNLSQYIGDGISSAVLFHNQGNIFKRWKNSEAARYSFEKSLKIIQSHSEEVVFLRQLKVKNFIELSYLAKDRDKKKNWLDEARQCLKNLNGFNHLKFKVGIEWVRLELESQNQQAFKQIYSSLKEWAQSDLEKNELQKLLDEFNIDPQKPVWSSSKASLDSSNLKLPINSSIFSLINLHQETDMNSEKILLALLEISQSLHSEKTVSHLLEKVLDYALELSQAESGAILLLDQRQNLEIVSSRYLKVDRELKEVSQTLAHQVLETGSRIVIDNALKHEETQNYESIMNLKVKSLMVLPIKAQSKVVGVLYLSHRHQVQLFSDSMGATLQLFADQVGMAVQKTQWLETLHQQAQVMERQLEQAQIKIKSYESYLKHHSLDPSLNIHQGIITQDVRMEEVLDLANRIAPTDLSVFIHGESGTGKELVARSLHEKSERGGQNFIAVNCATFSEELILSELFGHQAGAFTGAIKDKKGLFHEAHGGTLFLDEVGDLSPKVQAKLLRAIQEKEIVPLGSHQPVKVDVRVVSASLKDLTQMIKAKKFREDLYYPLADIELRLPPLRDRLSDIPLLVDYFLYQEQKKSGKDKKRVSSNLLKAWMNYSWPGNVRELQSQVRVAVALSVSDEISLDCLPEREREKLGVGRGERLPAGQAGPLARTKLSVENHDPEKLNNLSSSFSGTNRQIILSLLEANWTWKQIEDMIFSKAVAYFDGEVKPAAEALKTGMVTLYNRLKKKRIGSNKFTEVEYRYRKKKTLDEFKLEVFQLAYRKMNKKAYDAAHLLGVSPATFYKWIEEDS